MAIVPFLMFLGKYFLGSPEIQHVCLLEFMTYFSRHMRLSFPAADVNGNTSGRTIYPTNSNYHRFKILVDIEGEDPPPNTENEKKTPVLNR